MRQKQKKQKQTSKGSKKNEKVKASLKLPSIYLSSEWLHYHPIHGDRQRRENDEKKVPWSC